MQPPSPLPAAAPQLLLVASDGSQFCCEALRSLLLSISDARLTASLSVPASTSASAACLAIACFTHAPPSACAHMCHFLSTEALPAKLSGEDLLHLYRLSATLRLTSCRDAIEAELVSEGDVEGEPREPLLPTLPSLEAGRLLGIGAAAAAAAGLTGAAFAEASVGLTAIDYMSGAWRALYARPEESDEAARHHTSEAAAAIEPRDMSAHMLAAAELTALPDPFRLHVPYSSLRYDEGR